MINLLILDKEEQYGNALGKAISNMYSEFQVSLSSSIDLDGMDGGRKFDLIITSGYEEHELENLKIMQNRIIELVDYQTEDIKEQTKAVLEQTKKSQKSKKLKIFKYMRVSDIVSDLRYLYSMFTGKEGAIKSNQDTNIIGVYGASGGSGKSAISISIARELSRYHGKTVLYLSFDEIPTTILYMKNGASKRNLGDYLYYMFEKTNGNQLIPPETFTFSDEYGVNSFYPSDGSNELRTLNTEEVLKFIKFITTVGKYDYVILDMGSDIGEKMVLIMESCSKVILIEDDSCASRFKHKSFINYMERLNRLNFKENIISVLNNVRLNDIGSTSEPDDIKRNIQVEIESDSQSFNFKDERLEISINQIFGIGIKKIADMILTN